MKSKIISIFVVISLILGTLGCVKETTNDSTKFGSDGWHSTKVGKTDFQKK